MNVPYMAIMYDFKDYTSILNGSVGIWKQVVALANIVSIENL